MCEEERASHTPLAVAVATVPVSTVCVIAVAAAAMIATAVDPLLTVLPPLRLLETALPMLPLPPQRELS